MRSLLLALALGLALPAAAQTGSDTTAAEVFESVDQMPELVGGLASIRPMYPDEERQAGRQGRVFLRFVVDTDGTISDVRVWRGVSPGLDRAALAAVRNARFTPGREDGRPVRVWFTLPIHFRLQDAQVVYAATDFLLRNVRGGRPVARIMEGTIVDMRSCTDGWCLVTCSGLNGYAARANLSLTPPAVR